MEPEKIAITGFVTIVLVVGLIVGVSFFVFETPNTNGGHTGNIVHDTDLLDLSLRVSSDWEFELSNGTTISLGNFSGRTILVDLMATWCDTCIAQNSILESLYDSMGESLYILSLTIDHSETTALMAEYQSHEGLPWDHGMDSGAKFGNYFNVVYIPTLILIDGDGYFRYVHEGPWALASMTDIITSL